MSERDRVTPAVCLRNFSKSYRDTVAVAYMTLDVYGGQVLGVVGPNGAGKTTTFRALAGIIPPTHGELAICGHDIARQPIPAKRALAYIPDDPHLFDLLTVWEHLLFTAKTYAVPNFEPQAEALLAQFELAELRNSLASELSRGMRQKVAICCAYLHNPSVILFDEPLTGLDPKAIRNLKASIHQRASDGAAVLISSHLLSLIEDLCSHLLILHKGSVLFSGPIHDARSAFAGLDSDASLEDVFFRATEGPAQSAAPER